MIPMNQKYYILSIRRNGVDKMIVTHTNLVTFLLIEEELGYHTGILNAIEITQEEYEYYHRTHKK